MAVVVAFVSQKGGVGKSTLARALAVAASRANVKVMVADLDAQQSTAWHWNEMRSGQKLSPPLNVVTFDTIDEALAAANSSELLIVDTSGHASRATLDIARHAHLVVQPTGPGLDDLRPGVLLFHELAEAGVPTSRLVFALVRTATKDEETAARGYLGKANYSVLPGSIPERATSRAAHNIGRAITESDDTILAARAGELLDTLLEKLNLEVEELKRQELHLKRNRGEIA